MNVEILDYVMLPIVVLDRSRDGHFRYVWLNRAASESSGYSVADLQMRRASEMFPGRIGTYMEEHQQNAARSGKPYTYTYSVDTPAGRRSYEARLYPVCNENGKATRIISNLADLTENRELIEDRVHQDTSRIQMQDDAERFVSMAAHDLRSPMRNVSTIAAMLREDFQDHGDGKLELIGMLEDVSLKASTLIRDVLAYARTLDVWNNRQSFGLQGLCRDIFAVLDPHGAHDLRCDDAFLSADKVVLHIILRNLVDNALKHAETEAISLRISVSEAEAGDGMLEFGVRDNGSGFDDVSIAFLDGGDFRYGSGFGLLGLRRLIHARGGTIWVAPPRPGAGAEVHFTLAGVRQAKDHSISTDDAA